MIQSDLFDAHPSVTALPITSALRDAPLFRIRIEPNAGNGLRFTADVMVDKPQSIPRARLGLPIGRLTDETMLRIDRALALFLGFD